jgi:hypothetical protein
MRKTLIRAAGVCLFAGLILPLGQGKEPQKVSDLMRKKLDHAQKILEGMALNDFGKITRSSQELMLISKAAEWYVVKTPEYEAQSNSFRRAVETMIDKSGEKNIDGVALAYVDLTLSCVRCHKYVRDTRMTRLDGPPAFLPEPQLSSPVAE